MTELRSKVTKRPRSKLERLLDRLEPDCEVPTRPKNGITAQLALYYLIAGDVPVAAAVTAAKLLVASPGAPGHALATLEREQVDPLCPSERVDELHSALRAVGKAVIEGLATPNADLDDARKRLRELPRMPAEQADFLLLASGLASIVAPGPSALRVAARLGYPGASYPAIARSLDAEVPEGDDPAARFLPSGT